MIYRYKGRDYTAINGEMEVYNGLTASIPFYVEDISGQDNTLRIKKDDALSKTIQVDYSLDRVNWTSMGSTSTSGITVTIPANGRVYLRARNDAWGSSISVCNTISATEKHNIGGNIMSLLNGDNFVDTFISSAYAFVRLFNGDTNLVDASYLILPNKSYNTCYYEMFQGCTALVTAPRLTADVLERQCYEKLFNGCTGLKNVVCMATNLSGSQCLNNWMQNVSASGTFYKKGGVSYPSGVSGIPSGWSVVDV